MSRLADNAAPKGTNSEIHVTTHTTSYIELQDTNSGRGRTQVWEMVTLPDAEDKPNRSEVAPFEYQTKVVSHATSNPPPRPPRRELHPLLMNYVSNRHSVSDTIQHPLTTFFILRCTITIVLRLLLSVSLAPLHCDFKSPQSNAISLHRSVGKLPKFSRDLIRLCLTCNCVRSVVLVVLNYCCFRRSGFRIRVLFPLYVILTNAIIRCGKL